MSSDASARRAEYQRRGLRRADLDPDPVVQFTRWLDDASDTGAHNANAMVLATADVTGRPSARFVLLKEADERGFAFYTNGESPKAADLAANPRAALCFGWLELERQVRVSGTVVAVDPTAADDYWAGRARGSQLGSAASDQSRPLPDRAALEARRDELDARYAGAEVPRPPHWGGWRVVPDEIEMWQGRADRLHDRFRYTRPATGEPWTITRLAP